MRFSKRYPFDFLVSVLRLNVSAIRCFMLFLCASTAAESNRINRMLVRIGDDQFFGAGRDRYRVHRKGADLAMFLSFDYATIF